MEQTNIKKIIKRFNIGDTVYYISHENIIETIIKNFKRKSSLKRGVSYEYTDAFKNRFDDWFLFKTKEEAQEQLDSFKKRLEEIRSKFEKSDSKTSNE